MNDLYNIVKVWAIRHANRLNRDPGGILYHAIAMKRINDTQSPAITEEGVFLQHEQMELLTA